MSVDECICVASAASTTTTASCAPRLLCSDDDTVESTDSPYSAHMATLGAVPLDINVSSKNILRSPEMDAMIANKWPVTTSTLKLEKLSVNVALDITFSMTHHEDSVLTLAPQLGALLPIGGLSECECRTRILVHGEQQIRVSSSDVVTSPSNILRSSCQESWEEVPNTEGIEDTGIEDTGISNIDGSDSDNNNDFSVTGCRSGLTASKGSNSEASLLLGFLMHVEVSITATLYMSSLRAHATDTYHTLLLHGTGFLEIYPKLVNFRCLKHSWLLEAAQVDAKKNRHEAALEKWEYALPYLDKQSRKHGRCENAKLACVLHSMGAAYNTIGDSPNALGCLRRALAIRQQLHGEEHPDSARTMQAIGVVRTRDGELHEAFEYFWSALQYYEAFAPESLEAATTLQALASVYVKLEEYPEAVECYLRALMIRERRLGEENIEVATTLHNLGVVFEKLGDHSDALDSFQRALTIREKHLGQRHSQVARTLHSIGIVHSQLNNHEEALSIYQSALDIFRELPKDSADAAATLNNMGVIHAKLGHTENALKHHQLAVDILEKSLGPHHIDTLATKQNIQVLASESKQSSQNILTTFFNNAFFGADEQTQPFLCLRASHPQKWTEGHVDSSAEVTSSSVGTKAVHRRAEPSTGCKPCKLSL